MGAAIAGAVVTVLMKSRSRNGEQDIIEGLPDTGAAAQPGSTGFTVQELAGQNPAEWGGGSSGLNA